MAENVYFSATFYKQLIANLKELNLDDLANDVLNNITDANCNNGVEQNNGREQNNGVERSNSPLTDSSENNSLDLSDDSSREDDFHTKLQIVKEPLVINVRKSTKFRDRSEINHIGVYPMRSNPRGLVLIIANNLYNKEKDRRPSAKYDETNVKKLFEDMGFKVITYYDLTGVEIDDKIKEFSLMPELRKVDSAFVIISSHGSGKLGQQETEIMGIDYDSPSYKKVVCTKIMNYFTAENCRNLSGKPKIFIFQTCRGTKEQKVVAHHNRHTTDAASTPKIKHEEPFLHFSETMRNYEDMLIVYSTLPGHVSYRDQYNGSWFLQVLCEVFQNYAYKVHVMELFYMIDYRLKSILTTDNHCQTATITSQGFNKHCFINPGLFKDTMENIETLKTDVMFKCCPDRRANIYVCTHCESIYHRKCAMKTDKIQLMGNVKGNCCLLRSNNDDHDQFDNRSLTENVEELKKVLDKLNQENNNLKAQISTLEHQHDSIFSDEISLKNSEHNLKIENLTNENELLKQLNQEMRKNNELLEEKNKSLSQKMIKKKKNKWVKRNIRNVLKKRRKKATNTIEPLDIST